MVDRGAKQPILVRRGRVLSCLVIAPALGGALTTSPPHLQGVSRHPRLLVEAAFTACELLLEYCSLLYIGTAACCCFFSTRRGVCKLQVCPNKLTSLLGCTFFSRMDDWSVYMYCSCVPTEAHLQPTCVGALWGWGRLMATPTRILAQSALYSGMSHFCVFFVFAPRHGGTLLQTHYWKRLFAEVGGESRSLHACMLVHVCLPHNGSS